MDIANKRYVRGLSNYLDVLTAQKTLLTSEQQWVDSTATVSTNLVALYKALGGGWDAEAGQYAGGGVVSTAGRE